MKICIMGASTSTENMGVSALAVSLVKIMLNVNPDVKLSFIIGSRNSEPQIINLVDRTLEIPTVGYRLSPKSHISKHLFFILFLAILQRFIPFKSVRIKLIRSNPILREMYDSEFVADILGGDSFSDIYGLPGYIVGVLPMILVILLKKRLILLPQTYGPYNNWFAKILAKIIILNSYYCFSRDKDGVSKLSSILKDSRKNYQFCPDVAFMLDSIKPEKIHIHPDIPSKKELVVGVNVNGLMYNGGYNRKNMFGLVVDYRTLIVEVIQMMLSQNAKVLLIPHTYGDPKNVNSDPFVSEQVIKNIKSESIYIVKSRHNQSEVKSIIGNCDFFIGSRMHACIAALSQGVPTIGIAYSKKFVGVFESIGASDSVMDCRKMCVEEIKSAILNIYKNRAVLRNTLSERKIVIKDQINYCFTNLVNSI